MPTEVESLFEPGPESSFNPTVYTRGPWDPGLLHGGPVAALFAEALQDEAAEGYQPARLTVDLMRPVPMRPMTLDARVIRTGRRLQLIEGTLSLVDGATAVARATLLLLSRLPLDASRFNPPLTKPVDTPEEIDPSWPPPNHAESFVGGAMDFRFTASTGLGSGVAWLRLRCPVLPGRTISPLARAAAAADVGNAVSARRDPSLPRVSFVNADLSLSISRLPEGEWIRLASHGRWEPTGIGSVTSAMSDELGEVGTVTNALVLQPTESFGWEAEG